MTPQKFDELLNKQLTICRDILATREKSYSTLHDRLHNFKQAAALQQCTSEQALLGMVSKHIIALSDAIVTSQPTSLDAWTEWTTDIINYMILLKALVAERVALEELGVRK